MAEYRCAFILDIDGKDITTSIDAAREMWDRMKDWQRWHYMPVIEVRDMNTGIMRSVDLDEIGDGSHDS